MNNLKIINKYNIFFIYTLFFGFFNLNMVHAAISTVNVPVKLLSADSSLTTWWTFDGKDTPWTSSTAATTIDKSGNANTGTLTNMSKVTSPIPGKVGQGLNFDGVDDYVQFASDVIGTGARTFCSWINPSTYGPLNVGRIIGNQTLVFAILNAGNTLYLTNDGGVHEITAQSSSINLNTWTHVCFTRTSGGTTNFYINGSLSGSANQNGGTPAPGSYVLTVGARAVDLASPFQGRIDDVRIYNRVLSAGEIVQLYNSTSGSKMSLSISGAVYNSLTTWWTFDGKDTPWTSSTAATTIDESGNANTGTLTNMSKTTTPVSGKIGQGLNFDGVDDYVEFSSDAIGTGARTFCSWINPTTYGALNVGRIIGNQTFVFAVLNAGNTLYLTNDGGVHEITSQNNSIHLKTWTHVCLTRTSGGTTNFYVNGSLSGSANQNGGTPASGSYPLTIGARAVDLASAFQGRIDDVRIYNRVLSAGEIQMLYLMGM